MIDEKFLNIGYMKESLHRNKARALQFYLSKKGSYITNTNHFHWAFSELVGEIPEHEVRERGVTYSWSRTENDYYLVRAKDGSGGAEHWSPPKYLLDLDLIMDKLLKDYPGSYEFRVSSKNIWTVKRNDSNLVTSVSFDDIKWLLCHIYVGFFINLRTKNELSN